ncbi:uncharacterized protein LOC121750790 [Salvia splendens]|uniref:uncharacterized protein LOC121750790 n=1 Tax=Salvia splendens TaxID=180675 RepID=UPI001C2622B2|nr:uncharacterized protein LOC121750790 [Salvia splendens]
MEADKGIKLEDQETGNCFSSGVGLKREYGECVGCFDLQDQIKKANHKCAFLESDIGMKDTLIDRLGLKAGCMELENIQFRDEVRKLKQKNEDLEKIIQDGAEKEKFALLLNENETLVCETRKSESDLELWKLKCEELEARVMELEKKLAVGTAKERLDLQEMCSGKMDRRGGSLSGFNVEDGASTDNEVNCGTPPVSNPSNRYAYMDGSKGGQKCIIKSRVKTCLDFTMEKSPLQKHSPSTLGSRPPLEPIYVGDSDDDLDIVHVSLPDVDCNKRRKVQRASVVALESDDGAELPSKNMHEPTAEHQSDEEETNCSTAGQPFRMHKRRKVRSAQIVTSESESDDNIPLSKLAHRPDTQRRRRFVNDSCSKNNLRKVTPRRRSLRVGDMKDNSVRGKCSQRRSGNQGDLGKSENMNDTLHADEMEEDESSYEDETLGGFIVNSTDESDSGDGSNCNDLSNHDDSFSGDCSDKSDCASECEIGYGEIMSGLRRGRKDKLKWEFESDMLADFGKSAELCMKAVCALYRQQTSYEQSAKAAIIRNGRGFSHTHASSGSALAEFLTDGDPHTDMNKTVQELRSFNQRGVEQCRKLANHYSKQLFEIYKNEEDPFFRP